MSLTSRPISLLLVDDDAALVRYAKKVLEVTFRERVTVTAFTDPRDAVQWLQDSICDVLITDLEMPEVSGLELIPIAKLRNAWTQIIVLTAHSTGSRVCEAMSAGAVDYLLKPVDRNQVDKVVGEAIDRIQRWQNVLRKALRATAATTP